MKKYSKILGLVLSVIMMLSLAACGSGETANTDPNAGVYKAVSAEMWGIEMAIEDIWTDGFDIELNDNGKCKVIIDGKKANGKWELDGTSFHVTADALDCTGTLEDGIMTLENVLDMGVNLTFSRDGVIPDDSSSVQPSDDSGVVDDSTMGEAGSGLANTYDYGEMGEFFLDYPEGYSFERKFGVDTLKSADESISIKFVADWGMDDYAATMEGYDLYVEESGGIKEEGLSYGGFEATRVTYEDSFGEVVMCTYILFGEGAGQYVGVNVEVNATSQDILSANSAEIEAILNSIRLG